MHHFTTPLSPHSIAPTDTPIHPFSPLPPTPCRVDATSHVYLHPGQERSCIPCILHDNFFPSDSKIPTKPCQPHDSGLVYSSPSSRSALGVYHVYFLSMFSIQRLNAPRIL